MATDHGQRLRMPSAEAFSHWAGGFLNQHPGWAVMQMLHGAQPEFPCSVTVALDRSISVASVEFAPPLRLVSSRP